MKKIDILNKKKPNFIGCWNIENVKLCEDIINFFEQNKNIQVEGETSGGKNLKVKKTTDIIIKPNDLKKPNYQIIKRYFDELNKCYLDYLKQWPFLNSFIKEIDIPSFNIQKYSKGDHFAQLHSERGSLGTIHRLFAWMTYLNDVEDGGQTYFDHYDVKIKPEVGKTLIWPSEWTHAHAGEILKSGSKYIITGWMQFPNK